MVDSVNMEQRIIYSHWSVLCKKPFDMFLGVVFIAAAIYMYFPEFFQTSQLRYIDFVKSSFSTFSSCIGEVKVVHESFCEALPEIVVFLLIKYDIKLVCTHCNLFPLSLNLRLQF